MGLPTHPDFLRDVDAELLVELARPETTARIGRAELDLHEGCEVRDEAFVLEEGVVKLGEDVAETVLRAHLAGLTARAVPLCHRSASDDRDVAAAAYPDIRDREAEVEPVDRRPISSKRDLEDLGGVAGSV